MSKLEEDLTSAGADCETQITILDKARESLAVSEILQTIAKSDFPAWHVGGRWLAHRSYLLEDRNMTRAFLQVANVPTTVYKNQREQLSRQIIGHGCLMDQRWCAAKSIWWSTDARATIPNFERLRQG